uniref:Uncharacterized protein n=1 Tax=Arundo donax TaxID=35708 RepID=A0A0A9FLV8_ARUDO
MINETSSSQAISKSADWL